jgi:DNA polymerase
MIIGEAWGEQEAAQKRPFVGPSGYELDQQLQTVGLQRAKMRVTNVVNARPPQNDIEAWFANKTQGKKEKIAEVAGRYPRQEIVEGLQALQREIDEYQPTMIVALGNTPLWALTGETGIVKWRGSIMEAKGGAIDGHGIKIIPTLHPAFILREYHYRIAALTDWRRVKREAEFPEIRRPEWHFVVPQSPQEAEAWFEEHVFSRPEAPVVADVENVIGPGWLICLGFAVDKEHAICIPFMHRDGGASYWRADDELALTMLCVRALRERPIIFHNGLHDVQIIARQWGVVPQFSHDTMVAQHVLYPGMLGGKIDPTTGKSDKKGSSLSLAFCASLYCLYYRHWKDDGRSWDASINSEDEYWRYNCEDTVRTFEVFMAQQELLEKEGLLEAYKEKMGDFGPVLSMMFRGINFDRPARFKQSLSVARQRREIQAWIDRACGHPMNVDSSPQMNKFFYSDLDVPPVLNRKTRQPTTDSKNGLPTIAKRRPVLRPLIERMEALRHLNTFSEVFLAAKLSEKDKRLRAALSVAGTESMRFAGAPDAFGAGLNLQNLPRPPED